MFCVISAGGPIGLCGINEASSLQTEDKRCVVGKAVVAPATSGLPYPGASPTTVDDASGPLAFTRSLEFFVCISSQQGEPREL